MLSFQVSKERHPCHLAIITVVGSFALLLKVGETRGLGFADQLFTDEAIALQNGLDCG
jgi:hypothetical protein